MDPIKLAVREILAEDFNCRLSCKVPYGYYT